MTDHSAIEYGGLSYDAETRKMLILCLYQAGISVKVIAAHLQCTCAWVSLVANRAGLRRRKRRGTA